MNCLDPEADGQWHVVCMAERPNGWQYAITFADSAWENNQNALTYVRRRCWRRRAATMPTDAQGQMQAQDSGTANWGKVLDAGAKAELGKRLFLAAASNMAIKAVRGGGERARHHMLQVWLHSACGLPRMDALKPPGKACDPFVQVTADGAALVTPERSSIKRWTQSPEWNEAFTIAFLPGAPVADGVEVAVFDHDTFSKDDYIGRAIVAIPPPDLGVNISHSARVHEYQIAGKDGRAQGTIRLSSRWV